MNKGENTNRNKEEDKEDEESSGAEFKEHTTTKLSTITIMIIITRTMMTMKRMIRSFSFFWQSRPGAVHTAAGRCSNEYPADSLSPQLYNPLSNWPSVRPP